VRSARTAISDSATLANEYSPSNTISCEPVSRPQATATTANPADVQVESSSARSSDDRAGEVIGESSPISGDRDHNDHNAT